MKKIILNVVINLVLLAGLRSQTTASAMREQFPSWQLSPRIGYDWPFYKNNTPYIHYKGGLNLGFTADRYWHWLGAGVDFDYIKNYPHSIYPTNGLTYLGFPVSSFSLTENKITRIFYGIGPSFRYRKEARFQAVLNLRIGLASIQGGLTHLSGVSGSPAVPIDLNFHAGYAAKNVLSGKAQVQFTYFVNRVIGLNFGAYYLDHFRVKELVDPVTGYSAAYRPVNGTNINTQLALVRQEPCNCNISSVGIFAGITIRTPEGAKKEKTVKKCKQCETYNLAVTAKDKYTGEILPATDVVVKNTKGEIVMSGTTNAFGIVVFNNITPADYLIEGKLYNIALEGNKTQKSEFKPGETLQKEIRYTDLNFILQGKAVVCNTTTALSGVTVVMKSITEAEQKTTQTNDKGEFIFNVKQHDSFTIYGRKENYLSQTEGISTKNLNRNTTLFIKLEVCMDQADCGSSIVLKNILYDLDQYYITEKAKPELNRLVQFMKDHPDVSVELYSHTDSRASKEYNQTLSQNRANAAVDYLVGQGISRSRLKGIGFGESKLLNGCADGVECTEAQHQVNRRTEVKVICPK